MLVLGKQYTKSNPNKIGGVIMLFELFKKELGKQNIDYDVIDLNWRNYTHWIFAYPLIISLILLKVPKHKHISFHGTANEFIYLAPITVLWAKLFNKKVNLRKFAGNFHEIFNSSNQFQQKLIIYALKKSDIIFFETKYLVDFFHKYNPNTYWFPNVREPSNFIRKNKQYTKKFLFIGQVKRTKGLDEIISVFKQLDTSYKVDIYGPLASEYQEEDFSYHNVHYKGVLIPNQILETMKDYDVLLLPTFHHGEGYPGVILEAFSVGLPVVATNLEGIKEIVTKDCGILVDKKNSVQLMDGIKSINIDNYDSYHKATLKRFDFFNSEIVTKKILEMIYVS